MAGTTARTSSQRRRGAAHENELLARWQHNHDQRARNELVRIHMPMVRGLARRYGRSSEPFDDLLQVASVGLIKAIDRFDPRRGGTLRSFAVPTVLGEVRRYFRDCGWSVHVPRGTQERALLVRDAQQHLTAELGHEPELTRVAEFLEMDLEQVLDALYALRAYESISLDATVYEDEEGAASLGESLGSEDRGYERIVLSATAWSAVQTLPLRERLIVAMRYLEDRSQAEIAARVGLSQMQVSRVLRRSIEHLQAAASAEA